MLRPDATTLLACVLLALAAPPAALGQTLPLAGMLPGSRQPRGAGTSAVSPTAAAEAEVGTWAEYRFRRETEAPLRVRYALVERTGEGDWLETSYLRSVSDRLLVRVLVQGRLGRSDGPGRIRRVIIQHGAMQALELPTSRGAQALPPAVPSGHSAQTVGTETIRVGNQTVEARHVRAREGPSVTDAWVSPAVPLWGLVRFSSRRYRMDLLDFGTGARSALVGEPVRFDPAQLGR